MGAQSKESRRSIKLIELRRRLGLDKLDNNNSIMEIMGISMGISNWKTNEIFIRNRNRCDFGRIQIVSGVQIRYLFIHIMEIMGIS